MCDRPRHPAVVAHGQASEKVLKIAEQQAQKALQHQVGTV